MVTQQEHQYPPSHLLHYMYYHAIFYKEQADLEYLVGK
jgi:hypothetical protein